MKRLKKNQPIIAILYWFYKEPDVTKNHLELIRKNNPDVKIYGLFGGELAESKSYQSILDELLDDFWTYPGTYGLDKQTKWLHGDLMLLDWYDKRGRNLEWDSIAITQWDMLLFTDIYKIVPDIQKDQMFFSGYSSLSGTIESRWHWTKPGGDERKNYLEFCEYVSSKYNYKERHKFSLFIFEILTRDFLDLYLKFPNKKIGMLEYKCPTLAYIAGLPIHEHDIGIYYGDKNQQLGSQPLNAEGVAIDKTYVQSELNKTDGWRFFHPYQSKW